MATRAVQVETPRSLDEAAVVLRAAGDRAAPVWFRGGGTKLGWGARPPGEAAVELRTTSLDRIVEHTPADLTAVLEAGVPLVRAQAAFAEAGLMLALDPPPGADGDQATLGGVVATGDSGPLRHRYGGPRDLLLGMTVVLSDGTVARSGGKVIKNVAGYDLAKLFAGSFGTLGLIGRVAVRLHPAPRGPVTVTGSTDDPEALGRAALALSHAPLELEALDVAWTEGDGRLLARCAGDAPGPRAQTAMRLMAAEGLEVSLVEHDEPLWDRQRAGQRSTSGLVAKVSALPADLARVLRTADAAGGSLVGRAGLGLSWVTLPAGPPDGPATVIADLRRRLSPRPVVIQDAPPDVRSLIDVWGDTDPSLLTLMRRLKSRFDPAGVCNRGRYVGGL